MLVLLGLLLSLNWATESFIFEVKKATAGAHDSLGHAIHVGNRLPSFSMRMGSSLSSQKKPCVTVTNASKGGRLIASRGAMFMVFRHNKCILGSHRTLKSASTSKISSAVSSPRSSPRRIEASSSGSTTPTIIYLKDGVPMEKRQPKIAPRSPSGSHGKIDLNSSRTRFFGCSDSSHSSISLASSKLKESKSDTLNNASSVQLLSSESTEFKFPRLIRSSDSQGTLDLLSNAQHSSTLAKNSENGQRSLTRARSRSHTSGDKNDKNVVKKEQKRKSDNGAPSEPVTTSVESNKYWKSSSAPLRKSEKKRIRERLILSNPDSITETKKQACSLSKKSSPRSNSTSTGTSPRKIDEMFITPGGSGSSSLRSATISPAVSRSGSQKESPRTLSEDQIIAALIKNVDQSMRFEEGDEIFLFLPEDNVPRDALLNTYNSMSDNLDEIDLEAFKNIGDYVILRIRDHQAALAEDAEKKNVIERSKPRKLSNASSVSTRRKHRSKSFASPPSTLQ